MTQAEIQDRLTKALLQAVAPLTAAELISRCALAAEEAVPALDALVGKGLVVTGDLRPGVASTQYCWAAWWHEETARRAAAEEKGLMESVASRPRALAIDSEAVVAFNSYIVSEYTPPPSKRFLVFFQCSVRRPFSKSPSHASMRRAIAVATGYDPARDFEMCPVHVVVLASNIGPVPYELEDVHPANVGGGGVKHFSNAHYSTVKPILARRMADYLAAHGSRYAQFASFTDGRYGDVMAEAKRLAGRDFSIFPVARGPRVTRAGKSIPRTYWQKCWIQLYLEVVSWLSPEAQRQAENRLEKLKVAYE